MRCGVRWMIWEETGRSRAPHRRVTERTIQIAPDIASSPCFWRRDLIRSWLFGHSAVLCGGGRVTVSPPSTCSERGPSSARCA